MEIKDEPRADTPATVLLCQNAPRTSVQESWYEEWSMPDAWRHEHGSTHRGRPLPDRSGAVEARPLHSAGTAETPTGQGTFPALPRVTGGLSDGLSAQGEVKRTYILIDAKRKTGDAGNATRAPTRVEELVHQILLDPNVPGEEIFEQQRGKGGFIVEHTDRAILLSRLYTSAWSKASGRADRALRAPAFAGTVRSRAKCTTR